MFLTRQIVAIHSDLYLFKQCTVFQQLILIKIGDIGELITTCQQVI